MPTFHFPLLTLVPGFDEAVAAEPYRLVKRAWNTSVFDLATLATKHRLHIPYQLMDVFLARCNVELGISNASTIEDATSCFMAFRIGLYVGGVSPFICPFSTTESVNHYSGINERDSALQQGKTPAIASPFSTGSGILEAWPMELAFACVTLERELTVSPTQVEQAAAFSSSWGNIESRHPVLKVLSGTLQSAPKLVALDQSLLHIWTGIESLFPTVDSEVSFRVALYVAVLCAAPSERAQLHQFAKSAYRLRSKVAHGTSSEITPEQWLSAWSLLVRCARAIYLRKKLPTEGELLEELFSGSGGPGDKGLSTDHAGA